MSFLKKTTVALVTSLSWLQVIAQEDVPAIDYTQLGTPMPTLSFMEWIDTSAGTVDITKRKRKSTGQSSQMSTGFYKLSAVNDLKNNGNTAVMIFSPECTHCNKTVALLEDNLSQVANTKIVLLTTAKMQELIPFFAASHPKARPPKVFIGYDSAQFVAKTFLYQPLPQVNVYDANGILIKSFVSDVVKDSLSAWAH